MYLSGAEIKIGGRTHCRMCSVRLQKDKSRLKVPEEVQSSPIQQELTHLEQLNQVHASTSYQKNEEESENDEDDLEEENE
ncbi:9290_t:CDS:2 [Acaulospora colombiana]|uniref:9290_t:CDS:1 n=1 Tax=Acaulospora colombiana TaxID=27376 RepID=A0ACA9K0V2_9GLOM|nr:9290_t:CDS:2 [Acaulospora colombiana]